MMSQAAPTKGKAGDVFPGGKEEALNSKGGYDFSGSSIANITQRRFDFGPRGSQPVNVDQTLAHLFDTLSVECSGILVHPQWKHFRHILMLKNDKIRLSNGIWRSWHLQFQKKRKPLYCSFDIDPGLDHHTKQEAVVLEGKYWKRKPEAVASEYRKWRYYREKNARKKFDPALDEVRQRAEAIFVELTSGVKQKPPQEMQVDPPRSSFLQELEKFAFDEREPMDAYTTYDVMVQQPNLDMLNPMMDDFLNKISEPVDMMSLGRPPMSLLPFFVGDGVNSTPATFTSSASHSQSQHSPTYDPHPSQQQQQQQQVPIPMQIPIDNLQTAPPKDAQSPLTQQDPYPGNSFSLLAPYQDMPMTEQTVYSPSSFLNVQSQEQDKREGALLDIQQAGNYALKCEDQMSRVEASSPGNGGGNGGFFRGLPMLTGFQQAEFGVSGRVGRAGGNVSVAEGVTLSQQQTKVSDGTLESVLNQFYQPTREDVTTLQQREPPTELTMLPPRPSSASHISPGHHTPQSHTGMRGSFQYPPASPLASPPPPSATIQQQPNQRKLQMTREGAVSQFVRVSSAGDLPACVSGTPARPPLERGKSEPIRHLQDKIRNLSAQHMKQMEELDKHKTIAEVQYSELSMQVMPQLAKAGPSEEQQQVLQSVFSDPSLVKILRSMLLSAQQSSIQQTAGSSPPPPHIPPAAHLQRDSTGATPPPTSRGQTYAQQVMSPVNVLSPTQLTMSSGAGDYHSQLMASVSQMTPYSGPSGASAVSPPPSSSATGSYSTASYGVDTSSPPLLSSDTDISPTQTMIRKFKNSRTLTSSEKEVYREIRRQSHISAEQKRRGSIKHGFDQLQMLVINASAYPSGKVSKAAILEKTLEHIHRCHVEKESRELEMESLRARIEELNSTIALCQEKLPASGAPVTRQRFEENRQRFRSYVQKRTLQNYKFGVFSIILRQLFESYNSMVSIGTVDELCRTVLAWFEQNCNLPSLRPIVMNSLKELSQRTAILSDPSQVPRQLTQYAQQQSTQDEQQGLRSRRQQQQQQHHVLNSSLYSNQQ